MKERNRLKRLRKHRRAGSPAKGPRTDIPLNAIMEARIRFSTSDGMPTIESIDPPVSELTRG